MSSPLRPVVITTINPPVGPMAEIVLGARARGVPVIIAGDTKTRDAAYEGFGHYLPVEEQHRRFGEFSRQLPTCHYSRKNLGYLAAAEMGATAVQETDDDNAPYESFWDAVPAMAGARTLSCERKWFNVYSLFSGEVIWPRGLPLEEVRQAGAATMRESRTRALIVQDLADDNPDVDAVYRLTRPLPVRFRQERPVVLAPGVWCPFNSQATIFDREVFPLLYLPSHCSFRMTDIWRSFVAQRCLWEHGEGVVFRSPTVRQDRNEHSLLRDFEAEVPGYLHNEAIRARLESTRLAGPDPEGNLVRCYEALEQARLIPPAELPLVRGWCEALSRLT